MAGQRLVRPAGSVEGGTAGDIKHCAVDGQMDGLDAVVLLDRRVPVVSAGSSGEVVWGA